MISLRTHAISLAAVFLALAIGLALGSGFFSGTVASALRDDKREMQSQIEDLTGEQNALNEKLSAADEFAAQIAPRVLRDALGTKSVVLFRTPDAAADDVEALTRLIGQAGASVAGTITLTDEFIQANSAEKLMSVVNSPILPAGTQLSTAGGDQGAQAGDLLGIALLTNPDPRAPVVTDAQRDTVLQALRETGFVTFGAQQVGAAQVALIVTGAALGEDAGNQGSTVARFADGVAGHGSGTVLAGRDGSASGTAAVAVTRSDPALAAQVSTVDDIGTEAGRVTAVLALAELANGGRPGQFGTGPGATAVTVPQ